MNDDMARGLGHLERSCPVRTALDVLAGRWKPSILEQLASGPKRFRDLAMAIDGISNQSLSVQLKELVADGVVVQDIVDREVNGNGSYLLSQEGEALAPIMDDLTKWGQRYLERRSVKLVRMS